MPNHVKTILKMDGITKLPLFTKSDDDNCKCFDFNRIIPMPPDLAIEAGSLEPLAIEAVSRKVSQTKYRYRTSHLLTIMSDADYLGRIERSGKSESELLELGLQYISNAVKYGATTWFGWCTENWGTKWNTYCNSSIDSNTISFKTAWNFPEPIIIELSKMYPDLKIEVWWADEDIGRKAGHSVYVGGEVVDGGRFENDSNEAYAEFVHCWGQTKCLSKDSNGIWHLKDCENCDLCD